VFAARFIVVLRTLAALLAGANRMQRGRFMVANVAGSVVWATLYGFGAYWLGHEAKHVAGPIAIGICAMVVAALVIAGLYMRHREHKLLAQPARAGRRHRVTSSLL
jgi:membrane protein DedA with SNARE-associated domain